MDRTGKVTVNAANIRSGPGTSYEKLCTIYRDHVVQVNAVTTGEAVSPYGDQWYRVTLFIRDRLCPVMSLPLYHAGSAGRNNRRCAGSLIRNSFADQPGCRRNERRRRNNDPRIDVGRNRFN
jgi:uncharacterized protein YraI